MIPILAPVTDWYCPNCGGTDQTREAKPHTRFHACRSFAGLSMPLARVGTAAKITLNEREDYVGAEVVRYHEGRPIMNITTERDDGQDCVVFAPTATAGATV